MDPSDNLKAPVEMPRLTSLLTEWGINATKSVVVDLSGLTQVATVPVVAPPYPGHPITERFNLITLFPMVRAVVPAANPPSGRTPQPILQTHQRSWAETTLTQLETPESLKPEPDKGDLAGPVTIGVAVSVTNKPPEPEKKPDTPAAEPPAASETRIVAVGDSDFASNAYLGVEGNRDLFMNTVNWLAQQENLISIRPRDPADRRLTLTAAQFTMMFWLSIVLVPGLVMGTGVYTWWRRRG